MSDERRVVYLLIEMGEGTGYYQEGTPRGIFSSLDVVKDAARTIHPYRRNYQVIAWPIDSVTSGPEFITFIAPGHGKPIEGMTA